MQPLQQVDSANDHSGALPKPGRGLLPYVLDRADGRCGGPVRVGMRRAEAQQKKSGAGVSSVLYGKCRQGRRPPVRRHVSLLRSAPVPLQLLDDLGPRKLRALVAGPELTLILDRIRQPGPHQIAGAGANQKLGHGSGWGMEPLEGDSRLSLGQVGSESRWQHGSDLTEGERACDIKEEAHLVASHESGVTKGGLEAGVLLGRSILLLASRE